MIIKTFVLPFKSFYDLNFGQTDFFKDPDERMYAD